MQFLSDVYVPCAECDGARFQPEVLEVRWRGRSDPRRARPHGRGSARALRATCRTSRSRLQPLVDVGLDYLRLGQPLSTLSGGEAQRIKLAAHLGREGKRAHALPLRRAHDGPPPRRRRAPARAASRAWSSAATRSSSSSTTSRSSKCADWVIDLGPEGGAAVAAWSPRARPRRSRPTPGSHTGALPARGAGAPRRSRRGDRGRVADAARASASPTIRVVGAREHNLRDVCSRAAARPADRLHRPLRLGQVVARVRRPLRRGAAPLPRQPVHLRAAVPARDGQARRRRAHGPAADGRDRAASVARRPQVDRRDGHRGRALPAPAVREARRAALPALRRAHPLADRRADPRPAPQGAPRRRGHAARAGGARPQGLPQGGAGGRAQAAPARGAHRRRPRRARRRAVCSTATTSTTSTWWWRPISCPSAAAFEDAPGPRAAARQRLGGRRRRRRGAALLASASSARPAASGFAPLDPRALLLQQPAGRVPDCAGAGVRIEPDPDAFLDAGRARSTTARLLPLDGPERRGERRRLLRRPCARRSVPLDRPVGASGRPAAPDAAGPRRREDVPACAIGPTTLARNASSTTFATERPCESCDGTRLNARARAVRLARHTRCADLHVAARARCRAADRRARASPTRERPIAEGPLREIGPRLALPRARRPRLSALDRRADTLSGGEAQRIRLAAQLGSNLRGVCYVLDEPTIGLHPRDNAMLLDALETLRDARQHRARRRARRGDDPPRRPGRRPRARAPARTAAASSPSRRRPSSPTHPGVGHGPLPRRAAHAHRRRPRRSTTATGSRSTARASTTCRDLDVRAAARRLDLRHRRLRLRQVDAGARRPLPRGVRRALGFPAGRVGRAPGARRASST